MTTTTTGRGAARNRKRQPGVDGEPWIRAVSENSDYRCVACDKLMPLPYSACYTCATGRPRRLLRPEERTSL